MWTDCHDECLSLYINMTIVSSQMKLHIDLLSYEN